MIILFLNYIVWFVSIIFIFILFFFITKGVYGLGWVALNDFFNSTHHGRVKKKTQSSLTHHKV